MPHTSIASTRRLVFVLFICPRSDTPIDGKQGHLYSTIPSLTGFEYRLMILLLIMLVVRSANMRVPSQIIRSTRSLAGDLVELVRVCFTGLLHGLPSGREGRDGLLNERYRVGVYTYVLLFIPARVISNTLVRTHARCLLNRKLSVPSRVGVYT